MAISDGSGSQPGQEAVGTKSLDPSSSTRYRRNTQTAKDKNLSERPSPAAFKLLPSEEKKVQSQSRSGLGFGTSFIIAIAVLLGLLVMVNVTVSARVIIKIIKNSHAVNRNRANRRDSIELGNGVRLEEITTVDERNILQVYKGTRLSLLPITNGAFLIVEPRAHPLLSFVCAEFHKKVPLGWALYIVHSYANADFAQNSVDNIPRNKVFMQLNEKSLSVDDYNAIFKFSFFWDLVKAEHILIFQTDSVPCGPMLDMDRYGQFGYIGCTYYDKVGRNTGYWDDGWSFYGSGGLSLRRKSFTLECLQWYTLHEKETHEYEDVTFSHCVDVLYDQLQYPQPTLDDVGDFCAQNSWGNVSREPRSFGAHQHEIQMQDRDLKRRFLAYCPLAALI
jgi:hypothetical protein